MATRRDTPRKRTDEGGRERRTGRAIGLIAALAGLVLVVWLDERRCERPRWSGS